MANFLIFDLINWIALTFVGVIVVGGITFLALQFPRLTLVGLFVVAFILSVFSPASPF